MRAGRLRHRLRVTRQVVSENTMGEREDNWNEVWTLRGEIVVLRGAQLEAARKLSEDIQYKIRARYTNQVAYGDRLEADDGTVYEIMALTSDPGSRPRDLEMHCRIVT